MKIVEKSITKLKPYGNNPRRNDSAVEKVAASIKEFGFKVPVVITADDEIVAGHTRIRAAKKLGIKKVPCIVADDLTPEQIKAFRLADNKTAEFASWDAEMLLGELKGIDEIDMSQFGFDMSVFEEIKDITEDDFEPEEKKETRAKRGDIFEMGNHRLMCGDASSVDDMENLIGGGYGDLVFTDPPYGVSIGDKNKMLNEVQKAGRILENIENDTLGKDALYELLVKCFTNVREHCKPDASYYVTSPQGGEIGLMMMMMMMRDAGLEVRHNLIWKKNAATFSMGRLDYDYQHEPIFYTWTKKHNFYGQGYQTTIWEFDKPRKCDLHPTMKPVALIAHAIQNSSKKGDIVIDIFGGSGSTMIACEETGRSCRMMEIDPHYVDVIIARWEKHTGKQAVKINDDRKKKK